MMDATGHSGQSFMPRIVTEPELGGRWTSLRAAGREWLWHNPDRATGEARTRVGPGDAFVDAGGGEECFPTIRGVPDHGSAWRQSWEATPSGDRVAVTSGHGEEAITLKRRIDGGLISYHVRGRPGAAFVHAVHLLLDLSETARLQLPGNPLMRRLDADGSGLDRFDAWPGQDDLRLDQLGPDDGTASCLVLPNVDRCQIVDGGRLLRIRWSATQGAGAGVGLMLWRNLFGWPPTSPYRSIGVEPMLGHTADWSEGLNCARLDANGQAAWHLEIDAIQHG